MPFEAESNLSVFEEQTLDELSFEEQTLDELSFEELESVAGGCNRKGGIWGILDCWLNTDKGPNIARHIPWLK